MADKQHMALYRKWRPLTFSEVYGQAHITRALATQVAAGKTSHAYLFTGTRGTGKTSCAKILARAVNCLHPREGNPCNQCESCRGALSESALDITEIDAASMSGVDNIREIREEAFFAPTALKMRVYIIDEVHMLSGGAFNALLKTLEEPPEHVMFILATTELHKVPATILSRCQRYDFRRVPAELIAQHLMTIAGAEGVDLRPDAADLLAVRGDGSFRDAISLLDRAMTGETITRDSVESALGLAGSVQADALLETLVQGDGAGALAIFTRSYMQGQDMIALFDSLLSRLRDVYVLKATGSGALLLSGDTAALEALAGRCSIPLLEYLIGCVSELLRRLTRTAIRRTDGEMCILKMCLRHTDIPPDIILGADSLAGVQPAARRPAPKAETAPVPQADAADAPPWETGEAEPSARPESAPAPAEAQPAPTGSQPAPAGDSEGHALLQSLVAAVGPEVNSAVRTYLSLATACKAADVLHIQVAEEGLIFMDKPAVLDVLNRGAQTLGLGGVSISDQPPGGQPAAGAAPSQPADTVADILNRARSLGVNIKQAEIK